MVGSLPSIADWFLGGSVPGPMRTALLLLTLAAVVVPARAEAQESALTLAVAGGVSLPVEAFGADEQPGTGHDAGPALGVHFSYHRGSRTAIYGGFSQLRFGCGAVDCPRGRDLVSTGWELGLRTALSVAGVRPSLHAGLVFLRAEADGPESDATRTRVSDLEVGGEVGFAVGVPLTDRYGLRPGVRFGAADITFPDEEGRFRLRYAVVELALVVGF